MAFKHKYDVFISYDDEDVSVVGSFIDDLESALRLNGINTFKSLDLGGEASESLILKAIKQSKISIVALSPNYAKSRWCATELWQILNCKSIQAVLAVFYKVDRSELVEQKGAFGKLFFKIRFFRPSKVAQQLRAFKEVPGWDLALKTARGEVLEDITHSVMRILDRSPFLFEGDHLVGIDSHVSKVLQLLSGRLDKFLIVGITGEEGVGKTTLAKVIYNRIGHSFESQNFFENVSEVSKKNGLDGLRNKLISDLFDVDEIQSNKRALIVLDDVFMVGDFEALCGRREYFGHGSIIIITTSSKTLLGQLGVKDINDIPSMKSEDSLELFSWHAFKQDFPKEDFVELAREVVAFCHGRPLSLKVLGLYFSGRNVHEFRSALEKLRTMVRTHQVLPTLKISYEGLPDLAKDIFLVIYQFCIGKDKNCAVLNGYTADAKVVLIERGLVSLDENNKLQMHGLVKVLARSILDEKTKPDWMNDVFLTFRGEDTRRSFTSHLYSALKNAGIKAFMDDRLERGDDILSSLSSVIKESRISVVIFSTNYAGSRWCLEELEKIMECQRTKGQIVLPVFYNVNPSEVRKQIGTFGEAFEGLLRRISTTEEKVLSWKSTLIATANLSGWVSKNYSTEVELIDNILQTIFVTVDDGTYLPIASHPVGVNSRVQHVNPFLSGELNDVCIIGIWGMRGIGKTTLAKAIYNEVGGNFDGKSFLANVREVWEQDKGPVCLQEQLVSDTMKMRGIRLRNVEMGKIIIKEGLHCKRVLVVLDDVNRLDQLNALCGSREWFGQGSTIIITTTDKHLLHILQVDKVHELEPMEESESLELFSWHAFKKASPEEDLISLSRNIVRYSGGLPLALQVLGCYLFDREKPEWHSTFERLKRIPDHEIQEKLKISFDGLSHDTEKEIFLDISCFFIGTDRNYATQILNDCGCFAEIGISVLIQRSLVTVDKKNKLRMHDLLRDMGREIIRKESLKFPEERSRLWLHEDALDVLRNHTGTKTIEGLALKLQGTNEVHLKTKAFKKMRRLRLLKLDHVPLAGDYDYIPKNIRWLYWRGFPSKCIPADFYMGNVVAAELKSSKLKVLWKEQQLLEKLKFLNLSHSCYFTQTPDFSKLPNLEKLVLKDCPSLSMIHWSIGYLNKLLLVNLKGCKSLCNLPRSFYKLKSLETLILSGCSNIDKLEEDIEQMESLTTLMADNTGISHVPYSLIRAKSIQYISLCGHEGSSTDVFPSLVWSWSSPMNNPKSLGQASLNLSSIQINSYNDLSSILSSHSQIRSFRLKCQSEFHVRQDIAIICAELKTKQNATQMSDMGSSALSNCYFSSSLWIHLGEHTKDLEERISQGSTSGDKYPEWLTFNGEGSSVLFKIPLVIDCGLKGMTLHITYSHFLANLSFMNVLIINHTKVTIQLHKKEALLSPSLEERKAMISNLDPNDEVQVIVVFGPEFSVKNTTVHLIYGESVDQNTECSSAQCDNATQMNSKRCLYKEEDESLKRSKRR